MIGHKTNLSKFKKIKITPTIFSVHSGMKLDIKNKRKVRRSTNIWKLNNTRLNNHWVKEEIKREIKSLKTSESGNISNIV